MTSMVSSEFKFEFYTEPSLHYKAMSSRSVNLITLFLGRQTSKSLNSTTCANTIASKW